MQVAHDISGYESHKPENCILSNEQSNCNMTETNDTSAKKTQNKNQNFVFDKQNCKSRCFSEGCVHLDNDDLSTTLDSKRFKTKLNLETNPSKKNQDNKKFNKNNNGNPEFDKTTHENPFANQKIENATTNESCSQGPQVVKIYLFDILQYILENELKNINTNDYFSTQKIITEVMRRYTFDDLIGVHNKLKMNQPSQYLAFNIFDRFLCHFNVKFNNACGVLDWVGITCLFIAGKFEEVDPPTLQEIVYVARYYGQDSRLCTESEIIMLEGIILNRQDFALVCNTSLYFYDMFTTIFETRKINEKCYYTGLMLLEMSQLEFGLQIYRPSVLAFSVITLVTYLMLSAKIQRGLVRIIGTDKEEVIKCCWSIFFLWKKLKSVQFTNLCKKYSETRFMKVSNESEEIFLLKYNSKLLGLKNPNLGLIN